MADQKKCKKAGRSRRSSVYQGPARNKAKKIARHSKKHPNDNQAVARKSRDVSWYKRKKPLNGLDKIEEMIHTQINRTMI